MKPFPAYVVQRTRSFDSLPGVWVERVAPGASQSANVLRSGAHGLTLPVLSRHFVAFAPAGERSRLDEYSPSGWRIDPINRFFTCGARYNPMHCCPTIHADRVTHLTLGLGGLWVVK
jgi:hypothetical protein